MRHLPLRSPVTISGGGRTISWLLDMRAEQTPDRRFFTWEPFAGASQAFSYAEFSRAVARVAGGLRRRGVLPGDKILIHLDNCPELLLTWFACLRLGAVAVFANTRSAPDELRYCAEHSGAIAAVTQPAYAASVAAALPAARAMLVTSDDSSDIRSIDNGREHSFDALLSAEEIRAEPCAALAAAYVLYTSGTTGRPKGVVWTHANAMWAAKVNAAHEGLTASDIHLICLPLFHINAQAYGVLASLWAGSSFVLQPRFSASRFWEVSVRNRCTWASQIYFGLRALATKEVPADHCYRLWGTGVCGHPLATKFGVPTIGWWGMTETISHPIVGELQIPNRPGTIGHAAAEYEVAVVDENGCPVEPGGTGQLLVRGTPGVSLFAGYLHDDAATESAYDSEGWFQSGDRVTVHADGALTFADRAKDMLKIGAENVAASEIERVVSAVPGVREVAVVGAPDSMLEEVPIAFVVAAAVHPDLEMTIMDACRKNLADFKVPRAIRIVSDLPRSTLEKVAKHKLRELLRIETQSPQK
jgi:crotonobetaine/carnitine-CoA ligase